MENLSWNPFVNWCTENIPSVCSDHDNAVYASISVALLAISTVSCALIAIKMENIFDQVAANRIRALWIRRYVPMTAQAFHDLHSDAEIRFMQRHNLEPHFIAGAVH